MECSDIEVQLAEMASGFSIDPARRVRENDVLRYAGSMSNHEFYNKISLKIATKYLEGSLSYDIGDAIMNDLFGITIKFDVENTASPFFEVYLAFDAGEFHRRADRSDNPEADYTRPMLEELIARLGTAL